MGYEEKRPGALPTWPLDSSGRGALPFFGTAPSCFGINGAIAPNGSSLVEASQCETCLVRNRCASLSFAIFRCVKAMREELAHPAYIVAALEKANIPHPVSAAWLGMNVVAMEALSSDYAKQEREEAESISAIRQKRKESAKW